MKTQPVKGTRDFLPKEEALRNKMKEIIEQTYTKFGYNRISTPILEDIENLQSSEGGENLKLIFKILKRGEKLDKAIKSADFENIADLGLRYDLTVPLTRFYAQNKENLPKPFKAIQIDRAYRAERPQNGRMREFYQCDIDVLGNSSLFCEVELIYVTSKALENLGLKNFVIKINSRKLLNEVLLSFGYENSELEKVCIIFDKLDKIGAEKVLAELDESVENKEANKKFASFLCEKNNFDFDRFEGKKDIDFVMQKVKEISAGSVNIEFDSSLVRGQSYYTGCVFEIYSTDFNSALGGGGRYDNMVKKFIGEDVPAVGFSIGFERIFSLLCEQKNCFETRKKIAVLFDETNYAQKFKLSEKLRENYDCDMIENPKKLGKLLSRLETFGFVGFVGMNENEIKFFGERLD
ncbi:MAG: histidine--tRNA ligase [Christensenellales bacterium]